MLKLRAILARFRVWWYNLSSKTFEWQIGPILWQMAAIVAGLLVLLGIGGCGTTKIIPVENKEITKIEIRDSVIYRDTTIYIPQERIIEVVPKLDTLKMEIDNAISTAYLDTTMLMLRGTLESKRATQKEIVERIEIKERLDTVYIERPQPYEVPEPYTPKWAYYSLIMNIITILLVGFRIYLKFKL